MQLSLFLLPLVVVLHKEGRCGCVYVTRVHVCCFREFVRHVCVSCLAEKNRKPSMRADMVVVAILPPLATTLG